MGTGRSREPGGEASEIEAGASRNACAYDRVAPDYDRQLARDGWMRRALWRHFARTFRPGDQVLDVGCGTGIDAVYLASLGMHVTAIDASAGMVERLREKLAGTPLEARVEVHVGDAVEVLRRLSGTFDGVISSFAAMNAFDLPSLVPQVARVLRPGGHLVAHILSPGHARGGWARRPWQLFGRKRRAETIDVQIGGHRITHVVLPEDEFYGRFFASAFIRRRAYALGLIVRPLELNLPDTVLDWLARLEESVATRRPFVSAGRFYVLDLERRRPAGPS